MMTMPEASCIPRSKTHRYGDGRDCAAQKHIVQYLVFIRVSDPDRVRTFTLEGENGMKHVGRLLAALILCAVIILAAGAVRGAKADMVDDVMLGSIVVNSGNTSGPGWSFDPDTRTLTLSGITVSGSSEAHWYEYWNYESKQGSAAISSMKDLTIVLEGDNKISGTTNLGIFVNSGKLTIRGSGSLTITGATDLGIWVQQGPCEIAISGGSVTVTGAERGIVSGENLTISGGSVTVSTDKEALYSYGANITINGGTVKAEAVNGLPLYVEKINNEWRQIILDNNSLVITRPKNGYVATYEETIGSMGATHVKFDRIVSKNQYGREVPAQSVLIEPRAPHAVKVSPEVTGGEVDVPATAMPGATVTLGVKSDSAPALKWRVTDADGDLVPVNEADNTFVMPALDVTVFAWFSNPVVTLEFGEAHEGFVQSWWAPRVGQGWVKGVSGSQVYIEIEAGGTVEDAVFRAAMGEEQYDAGEYLPGSGWRQYRLKTIDNYTEESFNEEEWTYDDIVVLNGITLYAQWRKPAGPVNVTIIPPEPGTEIKSESLVHTPAYYSVPQVEATVTGNAKLSRTIIENNWCTDSNYSSYPLYTGKTKKGQTFYASICVQASFGYFFDNFADIAVTDGVVEGYRNTDGSTKVYGLGVRLNIKTTPVTVTFEADGGSGTMDPVLVDKDSDYTLPECGFTAPENKVFSAWSVRVGSGAAVEKAAGEKVTVSDDAVATAVWKEIPAYTVTDVQNPEHTVKDGNDTVITVKRSYDDQETYSLYTGAAADGEPIPDGGSSAAPGSLVLTLKADYLDTLSAGNHKVTISFQDGEAETTISIKAEGTTPTPTPTVTPTPTPTSTPTAKPRPVPRTGDGASPVLWGGLLLLGLAGMLAVMRVYYSGKGKGNDKQ